MCVLFSYLVMRSSCSGGVILTCHAHMSHEIFLLSGGARDRLVLDEYGGKEGRRAAPCDVMKDAGGPC